MLQARRAFLEKRRDLQALEGNRGAQDKFDRDVARIDADLLTYNEIKAQIVALGEV